MNQLGTNIERTTPSILFKGPVPATSDIVEVAAGGPQPEGPKKLSNLQLLGIAAAITMAIASSTLV